MWANAHTPTNGDNKMPKCIVMNVEFPKNKIFEVCVNGEKFTGETDVEIDLKEMFIHVLENAVVETMVPDPSKIVKLGEIYKIPKREPRYRVIRLEGKTKVNIAETENAMIDLQKEHLHTHMLGEGKSPRAQPIEGIKKPRRGNPNWSKKHVVDEPVESEPQLTEA